MTYATGLSAGPEERHNTIIHALSAGTLFRLKEHLTFDYTPTASFYSDPAFKNTLNHVASLSAEAVYANWAFTLAHHTAITSDPLVETSAQTDQQTHETSLAATCELNSKTSLDLGFNQNLRFISGTEQDVEFESDLASSREWSANAGINYQFWTRLRAGIRIVAGYVDVDAGSDMTFEQLNGTLTWVTTDKLSFTLTAGGEVRQFLDSAASDLINPVFSASIRYQPVEPTVLLLTANRSTSASYFRSQVVKSTTLNAGLQQRLLKRLYLAVNGGYRSASYESTEIDEDVARTDEGFDIGASLSFTFLKRASFSVFYNYNKNSSSADSFAFSSSQAGFEIGYRY